MRAALTMALALSGPALACGVIDEPTRQYVERAAAWQGLPEQILTALVWQESKFCRDARSGVGAVGYGQLMPDTARGLGVNPYDARQNILGAALYLRQQWDTFRDWRLALAAYNAGPKAVQKYKGLPPYPETQGYVVSVLGLYAHLMNVYSGRRGQGAARPVTGGKALVKAPVLAARTVTSAPAVQAATGLKGSTVAPSVAARKAPATAPAVAARPAARVVPSVLLVVRPGAAGRPASPAALTIVTAALPTRQDASDGPGGTGAAAAALPQGEAAPLTPPSDEPLTAQAIPALPPR